jgi:hypothetical protein
MVLLLLAPLRGGRWISFQDLDEPIDTVPVEEVVARVIARVGEKYHPTDLDWFAPFRMHRRIVSRLADGKRFLIGDAAHLSSPFGGDGLNAGLHDGCVLAWKLALVLRGQATKAIVDGYITERRIADNHVLDVSDQVHCSIADVVDAARERREIRAAVVDPITAALMCNSRAMIDVDYSGSPQVADYGAGGVMTNGPHPGRWYPAWSHFGGTSHCVRVLGDVADKELLARFNRRWSKVVEISEDPSADRQRAGLAANGIVMIRPDGHIGFRFPSTDPDAFRTLDRHLSSYLMPEPVAIV